MLMKITLPQNQKGFTLPELLVVVAIGGFIMAAVMTYFTSANRVYLAQDDVTEMQQNARAAMEMLVHDIHMAGYNPNSATGTGIATATAGRLGFAQDLNGDGDTDDPDEKITYGFKGTDDANVDGKVDSGIAPLGRYNGTINGTGQPDPVANNFQAIEFRYLDHNGNPTGDVTKVRSIQISFLVKTANPDTKSQIPDQTYITPSGATWTSTGGYRSRFFTTTVQCRNLGL
jgi:type IV pilus assembly protein PilW